MKKITLFFIITLISNVGFGQNLIQDGVFDTQTGGINGASTPWTGFNSQVIGSGAAEDQNTGNGNNGEAAIFQVITVAPGETYKVDFDYKWISGNGNYDMTIRVKDNLASGKPNLDLIGGTSANGYKLSTTTDTWFTGTTFSFLTPAGVTEVRLLFYKVDGVRPLRIDNISLTKEATASLENLSKFNFRSAPNPANKHLFLSASEKINKVEIYNLVGQKVASQIINATNDEVEVHQLSKGIYILKTYIKDFIGTQKFIKE